MKISNLPISKAKIAKATDIRALAKRGAGSVPPKNRSRNKSSGNPAIRYSSKSKFVLFVGDEGAILIYIKNNVVQNRQFVPDGSADHLKELQATLEQNTRAPLLLVVDNMDQTYVQQTLPPVSPLSVNRLIKRRLDRDFSDQEIKGAIVMGREQSGRKDWNFLMVALEKSPQLTAWIDFIYTLRNHFQGIYLVATETELIVSALEAAMGVPREGTGAEWKFFVSHNKVGGVRQVILRNGRLIFTRMTQLIGESTPAVIAGNIEQEILSTMEYMRRLSFTPQAGLDIYIVGSSELKPLIDPSKFNASSMHILTPYETAQYLGIEGATQPTDQFGDVILAATIGCSKKHILTLTTPKGRQLGQLYQVMLYQRAAAALVALSIIGYTGDIMFNIYSTYAKKIDLAQEQELREKTLETLRMDIKKSHLDVEKASDLIDLYQKLMEDRLTPLPFIKKISAVIKSPIEIKTIAWSLAKNKAAAGRPQMTATFTLDFPGVDTPDAFHIISKKITGEIKEALKGAEVKFTKLPRKFTETEKVDISFGNTGDTKQAAQQPKVNNDTSDVELVITGDVLTAAPPRPALPPDVPQSSAGAMR